MFTPILRALGLGGQSQQAVPDSASVTDERPNSDSLMIERLRAALQQYRNDAEQKYYEALPPKADLDARAQEIAHSYTDKIPEQLETNARRNGWNFVILDVLARHPQPNPSEHQARIRAASIIKQWCKDHRLEVYMLIWPDKRGGDYEILSITIYVNFK